MRLGLAGVGRIGAFHAGTLAGLPAVSGLVVADADPARAREIADRFGVQAADSVDALFASGLDGLAIATGTDAHAPLLLRALEAGLPVFCEKPVAADVDGTLEVLAKVAAGDVPVHIGFQRRFDAGYVAAREAVSSGSLGWVHTIRAGTLDAAPPHPGYVPTSGGIFRDCSVHDFDIVRWVSGHEVVEVYALGANRGEAFFAASGDVDSAAVLLTLDDGTFAHVMVGRYNARGYDVRLEVLGSQDSISVGLDDRLPLRSVEPGVAFPAGTPYPGFMERFGPAYVAELTHFADMVAGRAGTPCTVADALEAFSIAEACERSRHEHRPVTLAEVRR